MKMIMPLDETAREITQTASVLAGLLANRVSVNRLAAELQRKSIERLIFIGSGDSYAIAQFMAMFYKEQLGMCAWAIQSYDFITQLTPVTQPDKTAIFIITASGRPSPIMDALIKAKQSGGLVIAVTNQERDSLLHIADVMLYTRAKKAGMPTQSTTATLFLLLQLAALIAPAHVSQSILRWNKIIDDMPDIFNLANDYCRQLNCVNTLQQPLILLASGINNYIAQIGCNLLACGPQILAHSFLIEEYHHSLRLLHNNHSYCFILLLDEPIREEMFFRTAKQLMSQGAKVTLLCAYPVRDHIIPSGVDTVSFPHCNGYEFSFYGLLFLQMLSLKLAEYFTEQGGERVAYKGGYDETI